MEKLLVVSSFPPKGQTHAKAIVGVASYTKNTLVSLVDSADDPLDVTVLAEVLEGEASEDTDGKIKVSRVWKRGSLFTFPRLLKEIVRYQGSTKNILLELELSEFGGTISLIPIPVFLIFLRLMGKHTTVVFHQVINNLGEFAGHINTSQNSFKTDGLNALMRLFYTFTLFTTNKAIVFDEELKNRLGNSKKVVVIPHGVEEFTQIPSRAESRKKLQIEDDSFVVLYFGFLAWYKGADWLVHEFSTVKDLPRLGKAGKSFKLIMAGGINANHKDKTFYTKYVDDLEDLAKQHNITVTGFVAEKDIPTYFQAADVAIFPYRTFMSSSGPLSMAFSFNKPFLVSDNLRAIFNTKDIEESLKEMGLDSEALMFDLSENLESKLKKLSGSEALQKIQQLSAAIAKKRSWKHIGALYYEALFPKSSS